MKTLGESLLKPLGARLEASASAESPIESILLTTLLERAEVFSSEAAIVRGLGVDSSSPHRVIRARLFDGVDAVIVPQCRVDAEVVEAGFMPICHTKRLRLDLGVVMPSRQVAVAVECDGHAFHDTTPEQAAWDRARDRALQAVGWSVARFTGTEITREPVVVARLVGEFCERLAARRSGFVFFSHPPPIERPMPLPPEGAEPPPRHPSDTDKETDQ
jgi:hypothetical protein